MKKVGAWSIDMQLLNWIDTKLGSKSQFVNRILKDAYIDEIMKEEKRAQRPKCPECTIPLTPNTVDDGPEWVCRFIHCTAGMV